jgi:hypothetical protein
MEYKMPRRLPEKRLLPPLVKDSWQSFGLQKLNPARFIKVVNKILRGKHLLVGPYREKKSSPESE